jgi:GH25 family lysozyme M1 (1,4-beta-N-acetylmuramidase)
LEACPIGIDVSHHQPPIDWKRVREAGYSFVIVRSSYGTARDMRAVAHAQGLHHTPAGTRA